MSDEPPAEEEVEVSLPGALLFDDVLAMVRVLSVNRSLDAIVANIFFVTNNFDYSACD